MTLNTPAAGCTADAIASVTRLTPLSRRCTAQRRLESPLGPLLLARSSQGLAGVWFAGQKHHPGEWAVPEVSEVSDDPLLREAALQITAYFAGRHRVFDLPLDALGTAFQQQVWAALRCLAPGQTCSYGELAKRLGRPAAVRAVAAAIGRNPLSIVVPCHRVLGAGGALTGYAGGLARKQALLQLEGAWVGGRVTPRR